MMSASAPEDSPFAKNLKDLHLVYDYNVHDAHSNPEKWRYETWFFSEDRVVYKIHGGPMKGRANFQTCAYQCVREGEVWQCNWLEETGTVVSLVYDIPQKRITTLVSFSKGHWENPQAAHGDKRNTAELERWRDLARIGVQTDRHMLTEQADVVESFRGKGSLEPVEQSWPTL